MQHFKDIDSVSATPEAADLNAVPNLDQLNTSLKVTFYSNAANT